VGKPADWTNLRAVIQYAESLGPGHVVFTEQGSSCYGICKETELPTNHEPTRIILRSQTWIWDVDKYGEEIPGTRRVIYGVLGKAQRRTAIYRVK